MYSLEHDLRVMGHPSTNIQLAHDGIHLIQNAIPSPTTLEKVKAIKKFLSLHSSQIEPMQNFHELIQAMKTKLIDEAPKDDALLRKIKRLPPILKVGLIFESESLLANRALWTLAKKLLIHGTPLIVNREFLISHRHAFFCFQIHCRCFHLKEGDLSLIIPERGKTLKELGFNENELVPGSFKEVPPAHQTNVEQDLDRLLTVAIWIGARAGHGFPVDKDKEGQIAGNSSSQFSKTQAALKSKGMRFCSIDSCFGSGSNMAIIEQTPFPVLVASSSETPTTAEGKAPSYERILDYVKRCLQNYGEPFDKELHEKIHEQFKEQPIENAPLIIFPNAKPIAITPSHHYFKCLQLQNYENLILLEGNEIGGFLTPGGTKNHLLKKVSAKNHTIKGVADETFRLLYLSISATEKGIFIGEFEGKSQVKRVMIFASKEGNQLLYYVPGFFSSEYYFCDFTSTPHKIETASETFALLHYYECFARTMQDKELIPKFQDTFFGKEASSPLHQMFASLLEGKEDGFSEEVIKKFTASERLALLGFANRLKLSSFVQKAESALTPPIIKCIQEQTEEKAMVFLKNHSAKLLKKDAQGKTPLFWAIHLDKKALISFILQQMEFYFDKSAFLQACEKGNYSLVEQILRKGGKKLQDLSPGVMFKALEHAAKHEELMQSFIYDYRNFKNILSNVVHLLVKNGHHKLLKSFLYLYCEGEDPKPLLTNALCWAVWNKDLESITILLEYGVDPNTFNTAGKSPLYYASLQDQCAIFELLVKKGADVNLQDKEGDTPFKMALSNRNYPLIATCIKNNGSFHSIPGCGKTLFELGMQDEKLMEVILEHGTLEQIELAGADPHFLSLCNNEYSRSYPLKLALEAQDFKLANRLKEKGLKVRLMYISDRYFDKMKNLAELPSVLWLLENCEDISNDTLNSLLSSATRYSSLEMVQAVEKLIYEFYPSFIKEVSLEAAFLGYLYDGIDRRHETYDMHKSDKTAYEKKRLDSEKESEKVFRSAIDQTEDFTKEGRFPNNWMLTGIYERKNEALLHHFLNAMIEKCKMPHLKSFYKALQEGHFVSLSQEEIPLCWSYLSPPFLLHNNTSKEVLLAIMEQMKNVSLTEERRESLLSIMNYHLRT